MEQINKKVVGDFIKSFSCVHSITDNLSESLGVEKDPVLLHSVIGFSSGIATMGDTCGVANGGTIVLSKKYSYLPPDKLYMLCSEYFSRLEAKLNTADCGIIHGGSHLTKNFRRSIMTGKIRKCVEILYHGTNILQDIAQKADNNDFSFIDHDKKECITKAAKYFNKNKFHCSRSVIKAVSYKTRLASENILDPAKGFIGGIGCNGTLCGAISGAVLCLGRANNIDISKLGYTDTAKTFIRGLIKNDQLFEDEKNYLPAKLFKQCKEVYHHVEDIYGSVHCNKILNLQLDSHDGIADYINKNKIVLCKNIAKTVAEKVISILNSR